MAATTAAGALPATWGTLGSIRLDSPFEPVRLSHPHHRTFHAWSDLACAFRTGAINCTRKGRATETDGFRFW